MRREFLQLAKPYNPQKANIAGWFISEKLDGTRCFWDGGVTRGLATSMVPWASVTDPKTRVRKKKIKPFSTGLWSRCGNPIIAPEWFLDSLPECPLDGELWAGRGKFQLCRSICAGDTPDPRFEQIRFAAYSCPPPEAVFGNGEIRSGRFRARLSRAAEWFWERVPAGYVSMSAGAPFKDEYQLLQDLLSDEHVFALQQTRLPAHEQSAKAEVEEFLQQVLDKGGEGIVIRDPDAAWTPKRVNALLKYKPFSDAEAVITGFTSGRETDRGSKHRGKIGALITRYKNVRLELSGLTDAEREFAGDEMRLYATRHPGQDMPEWFEGRHFHVGQTVTFKYRELSDDGVPKEARYWRLRDGQT